MKKKILISLLLIVLIAIIFMLVFWIITTNVDRSANNEVNNSNSNINNTSGTEENEELEYLISTSSIKDFIPENITSIERESYITGEKVIYQVNNYTDFWIDILETDWQKTTDEVEDSYYYILNINGDKTCHIKIYKKFFTSENNTNTDESIDVKGYAEVYDDNGKTQRYIVPISLYNTIHRYTNEDLNLYDSNLPLPNEDVCYDTQNDIFVGISNENKITVQNNIRLIHSYLENIIKEQELNDSTSQEWVIETSDTEITYQDLLGTQIMEYCGRLKENYKTFISTINMLNESEEKSDLLEATNLYNEAMNEHSVLKLYNAYKIIHDYDFFVINYPPYWNLPAGQSYPGVDAYFGSVDALN